MSDKIRWGVLSTAGIAQHEVIPAMKRADNAEVVAISSLSGRAQEVADQLGIEKAYDSYHEVLDDPDIDAVYIPLPNHLHKEWAIRAANKKKHILLEKPIALTSQDVHEIKQAVTENGVIFMEAFMYYFHPQHQRVKALIKEGAIGEVKQFEASFTFHLSDRDSNIRMDRTLGGGSLYDVGCYTIHAMRHILDEEPLTVKTEAIKDEKTGIDTTTISYFTFQSGKTAVLTSSFDQFGRDNYHVYGTDGHIHVPRAFRPDTSGGDGLVILDQGFKTTTESFHNDLYRDEVEHISYSILNDQEPILTFKHSYNNMKVIDAALRSIETGETEDI